MNPRLKKSVASFLLFATILFSYGFRVEALFFHDPINWIQNNLTAIATSLTAAVSGVPASGITVTGPAGGCVPAIAAADAFSVAKAETSILSGLSYALIGESEVEALKLVAELQVIGAAKTCVAGILDAGIVIPSASIIIGNDKTSTQVTFAQLNTSYDQRIDKLHDQLTEEMRKLLRAFLLMTLQNMEKDLTTKVVNGLVDKFKISNYLDYANALGGQVYSMDYIRNNYEGDSRQQMMLRSIIQSQLVPGSDQGIVASAFSEQKAKDSLGFDAKQISFSDPDFYVKMAKLAAPAAVPDIQKQNATDQASTALSSGIANANLEIANGKGFVPPRDCSGSVQQQQELDQKTLELARKSIIERQAYAKMVNSKPKPSAEELQKSREALAVTEQQLRDLPQQTSSPIIQICKSIVNPGGAVADQINSFLAKHLNASSDFKPENFPFFVSFLSDVASNFVTNIVSGGDDDSSILNESGVSNTSRGVSSGFDFTTPELPDAQSRFTGDYGSTNPDGGQNGDGGSGDTGDGGTGDDGNGGGTATPASCVQENNTSSSGMVLTCDSLPTGPGNNFIINIDFNAIPVNQANYISVCDLTTCAEQDPDRQWLEKNVSIAEYDEDGDRIIQYEVEGGISSSTRFVFIVSEFTVDEAAGSNAIAAIVVTPPGQVRGVFFRKLFLRSKTPSALLTSPRGLKLSLR